MTPSLVVLCVAAASAIAYLSSALLSVAVAASKAGTHRLAPAAQSRLLLAVTVLPALISITLMTAALAPSFGWIVDHCAQALESHAHPHICTDHHVATLPTISLLAAGGLLVLRVVIGLLRMGRAVVAAVVARRSLCRVALDSGLAGVRVLPFEGPQAFALGIAKPVIFVTQGLLSGAHSEHLEAVLAHERAHLRRYDSLRRLLALIALPFHLPGIAGWLERQLGRAHEMAADDEAATTVQSRELVANALVRMARATRRVAPPFALAFGASDIEARVTTLLDSRPRRNWPTASAFGVAAILGVAIVGTAADAIHHGVEILLGILGG